MEASNGTPRSIRLKEFNPGLVRPTQPEDEYLARTDGTLAQEKIVLCADNNGFLKTGNTLDGNRKKIIILGDSFVESYWAFSETSRWISVAERSMDQYFPGQFTLHNAGYSGATSLHMAMQLPTKMRPLFEDTAAFILFVPTNNDAVVSGLSHTFWTKNKYWSPVEPIQHSGDLPEASFDWQKDAQANWSMMLNYLKAYNVPTLVVAPPYRTGKWGQEKFLTKIHKTENDFENWKNSRNLIIDHALETARKLDVLTLDARSFMSDSSGNYSCFYDQLHLNEKGHNLFGHLFSRELANLKFWEQDQNQASNPTNIEEVFNKNKKYSEIIKLIAKNTENNSIVIEELLNIAAQNNY